MKNGVRTTEFWLTAIVSLAGIVASISNPEAYGKWGVIVSAIATAIYTIGRSSVKKNNG